MVPDIRHLPCGAVSSRLIDELRCKVNLGVVRPRVVLWVVYERTGRFIVDRNRDGGRGGATAVVGPNRVGRGRCLHDRWNAPNRSVARTKGEAAW